jgi:hypothetical protein
MIPILRKLILLLLAGALLSQGTVMAEEPAGSDQARECNPALAALIGGVIGAVLNDESRTKGAALGASLGALACSIINAHTRQTRPGDEVEKVFKDEHQGKLPDTPQLIVYDTAFNAAGGARPGRPASVVSNITLVQGAKDPVRDVREVLEVFDPSRSDEVILRAEKTAEEKQRTGSLQNTFTVQLPASLAPGVYPARTRLYVNGRVVGENRGALRIQGA